MSSVRSKSGRCARREESSLRREQIMSVRCRRCEVGVVVHCKEVDSHASDVSSSLSLQESVQMKSLSSLRSYTLVLMKRRISVDSTRRSL
jgi:hypothetical protein